MINQTAYPKNGAAAGGTMKYDFITVLDRTGADSIAANIDPWGVSPAPAQRIPM